MAVSGAVLERQTLPQAQPSSLPGGYMGRLPRVDLSTGRIGTQELPDEAILRQLVGG
ncbi:MAG TPA: hypothetical protein VKU60_15910 [Chloroflexota bacterium]|nr:hypothetical protein [Chloroflexota bacterium]